MSGVYFPKMQLPDKCKHCDLVFDLRASMYCPVSGEFIDFEDTPETAKCPGIPVPDHGRLIDADALIDAIIAKYIRHERNRELVFAVVEIKQDLADIINELPTIIPADKEGEA